jgi:hypothetical protein
VSSQRRDLASVGAVGVLCVSAVMAWYAAPDAPSAERPRALPVEGWVTQGAPAAPAPRRPLTPPAPPAATFAAAPALPLPSGTAARQDAPPALAALGQGTLVSHGSGVAVQTAPASGVGRDLGLAAGDRIVRINGRAVTQASEVATLLAQWPAQGMLRVDGWRNGKPISLYHAGHELSSQPE